MLIGFTLISLAASTALRASSPGNYDGAQLYLKGFMEAFQGKNYTLPAACLSPAFQSTLDHDVIALLKSLSTANESKVEEREAALEADVQVMVSQCDLMSVVNTFNATINQKNGGAIILGNIFWNIYDIKNELIKSFEDLFLKKYQQAGTELGLIAAMIVTKPNKLQMYADFTDFGAGLVVGLGADKETACYAAYQAVDQSTRKVAKDLENLSDVKVASQYVVDLLELKSTATAFYGACDVQGLLKQLFTTSPEEVMANYRANSAEVNSLFIDLKECESGSMTSCGYGLGSLVHLLTGASL
jgi:hypothetical protein